MNKIIALACFTIMLVGCLSTPSKVYQQSEVNQISKPIVRVTPRFPKNTSNKSLSGYIKAKYVVKEDGRIGDVVILESQPKGFFDAEGIKAIKKWRYRPAILNGKPVDSWQTTQLNWGK
ncbi:iron siderophore transporter TonB [Saccharobesus litoralis]|uniref:Protein TonB n=1 Tax=Saccharobesus litoralis TaxID=2172099 RepID=A0A2S0VMD9_9ALTE|nr:energy transducer TonB [Saccharobesus litoralis]AWB65391.1 iron siderophore transporter TonB [Saccharobesus litoralis]